MNRVLALVTAAAVLALTGCAAPTPTAGPAGSVPVPGISARGVGTVTGTPDTLTLVLGVSTRGAAAVGALEDNNAQATALIEVLRAAWWPRRTCAPAACRSSPATPTPAASPATR